MEPHQLSTLVLTMDLSVVEVSWTQTAGLDGSEAAVVGKQKKSSSVSFLATVVAS